MLFPLPNIQNDFNPRSHEGSDSQPQITQSIQPISIHAPTKGATIHSLSSCAHWISIHAPTKGATCNYRQIGMDARYNFNPRSHEGSDQSDLRFNPHARIAISIHAPTKGATRQKRGCLNQQSISIHAPTKGATTSPAPSLIIYRFQSTLPRRERQMARQNIFFHL